MTKPSILAAHTLDEKLLEIIEHDLGDVDTACQWHDVIGGPDCPRSPDYVITCLACGTPADLCRSHTSRMVRAKTLTCTRCRATGSGREMLAVHELGGVS